MGPLLTSVICERLLNARRDGTPVLEGSWDLGRSLATVRVAADVWTWNDQSFTYLERFKDRTIYYWDGARFEPAVRFTTSLIKLVPTEWGPPTFEIDGIKMLPTARISPYLDAQRKVALIEPRDKVVLDTCGGLGYFAACCIEAGAAQVLSFEKSSAVIWLRALNPWSPARNPLLNLREADVATAVTAMAAASVQGILHDPPRFAIAGDLYSKNFYAELARVLTPGGKLFHYTGSPNKLSRGRDLAGEVMIRLKYAGFTVEKRGDGVLARRLGAKRTRRP